MHHFVIELNRSAVSAPIHQAAMTAGNSVATFLSNLDKFDWNKEAELTGAPLHFFISGLPQSSIERRTIYERWLLAKGFQDLARGIRETLEEAALYLDALQFRPPLTPESFASKCNLSRKKNGFLNFGSLFEKINNGLVEPLRFDAEFRSMQKARNCLEHRNGIVGTVDVDDETQDLTLYLLRPKLFCQRDEEEVELISGSTGQAGDVLCFKAERYVRVFKLGEYLSISAKDFSQIAMACFWFGSDIVNKLPLTPSEIFTSPAK